MADINTSRIAAGRLNAKEYVENFSDLHPPHNKNKASREADRCYFCYDAPCMDACPTETLCEEVCVHVGA